jgi:hypothetical protein
VPKVVSVAVLAEVREFDADTLLLGEPLTPNAAAKRFSGIEPKTIEQPKFA